MADDSTVIEIGPGPGGLTRALLETGTNVVAVEKDVRCLAALEELAEHYPGKLSVLRADALEVDLLKEVPAPRRIVSNLPYNVGTPLLLKWLDEIYQHMSSPRMRGSRASSVPHEIPAQGGDDKAYESLTLMFQREVAHRITAQPGSKDYGRLSVMAQWLCEAHPLFDLPPGAFVPPPKVHSAVVVLKPRPRPLYPARKENLENVLRAAFGQRRKMLRQSLKSVAENPKNMLDEAGIEGTLRGEVIDISGFCRLAAALG